MVLYWLRVLTCISSRVLRVLSCLISSASGLPKISSKAFPAASDSSDSETGLGMSSTGAKPGTQSRPGCVFPVNRLSRKSMSLGLSAGLSSCPSVTGRVPTCSRWESGTADSGIIAASLGSWLLTPSLAAWGERWIFSLLGRLSHKG